MLSAQNIQPPTGHKEDLVISEYSSLIIGELASAKLGLNIEESLPLPRYLS